METRNPDISVVVPLYNEEESLPELLAWIDRVAAAHAFTYEAILVDDGSSDGSWAVVERLAAQYPTLRGIRFRATTASRPPFIAALRPRAARW